MLHITAQNLSNNISWKAAVEAIYEGHLKPKAILKDIFIGEDNILLSRAAFIEGLGWGVKSVTVIPENIKRDLPSIHGVMAIFDAETGIPKATIDSAVLTNLKTVADSLLGATLLADPSAKHLLIVGAGSVAETLIVGYSELFPDLEEISIWNRNIDRAKSLAQKYSHHTIKVSVQDNLEMAVQSADIISSATMTQTPILKGEWFKSGQHVDLIGAFNASMREADDALIQKGALFVDSYDSTVDHIGELKTPIANGIITRADIQGDLYHLVGNHNQDSFKREYSVPTIFKNGGGAHLDLMIGDYLLKS